MLQPKKKISRRELKEDALISSYAKVTKYYEEHRRTISIAVTAVVAVVILAGIYLKNRADTNERASLQLSQVTPLFDSGQFQLAIDGVPARNIQGLKAIVEESGSTPVGEIARFYLASAYLNLGKYQEALELFEDFSPSDDQLATGRYAGIGACQDGLGEYAKAGASYEKAAGVNAKDLRVPEYLSNAARAYARAGEKERALEIYRRLKKNHSTTVYGRDADRYIAQFSL